MDLAKLLSNLEVKATIPTFEKAQLLLGMLSFLYNNEMYYPKPAHVHDGQSFDFIIIGGGTAGCVLANRLTEANWTVLLIEAGNLPPFASDVPGLFPVLDFSSVDWGDDSINDGYSSQAHISRNVNLPQGKMLGGSSGLDLMIYIRGNKADYDRWAAMGNEGWSWMEVLPYFIKSENLNDHAVLKSVSGNLHGTHGPMGVTRPEWGGRSWKYLKAFQQRGHRVLLDSNGYDQLGYAEPEFTANNKIRQSTAVSYIRPIKHRKNLFILYNSFVTKISINKHRVATGVEVILKNGMKIYLRARKEVILSAGTFTSPKLLMVSGVGPRDHLEDYNIPVIYDNPYVGRNLHDTPMAIYSLKGEVDILSKVKNLEVLSSLDNFPSPEILGYATIHSHQTFPDYQTSNLPLPAGSLFPSIMCSHVLRIENHICSAAMHQNRESLFGGHLLLHPKSRGKVELQSRDPQIPAAIYTGYYSSPEDLDRHAYSMADFVSVVNTTYFQSVKGRVADLKVRECDKFEFLSHQYWKCYVLNIASTMWNYAGTCSMGLNEGVVDNNLRVKGIANLRVVDASVIPTTISGNIKAAVVMVAEKAADIIKSDHGLHYDLDPRYFAVDYEWLEVEPK